MGREPSGTEIAIVGMAGRFPGARDVEEYWRLLRDGVEPIRRLTRDELAERGADPAVTGDPAWVPAVSQLDGYAEFDADFFGVNPREAESMDPQHRVFLELAYQALEDAGHAPGSGPGRVAVFAGATLSTYLLFQLARSGRTLASVDPLQLIVGNAGDSLATRVSYKLGLTGPSHAVQCACSTSLVAVHLACQSLLGEECDLALAGGVSVNVAQSAGYRYVQDSILSPDGRCRPFDADAKGTLFASGAGVVALRRLEDALADGDSVRAVILGSAVNNDGSAKVGFTAPSVEGQAAVVTEALAVAGVDASEVSYVECHGTGTALGDPVEVQALTRAFRAFAVETGGCAIGSVKSNLGHLDIAAGVAGLIKTVLALEHEAIPPTLHFRRPNPKIDLAASPFRVAAELEAWPRDSSEGGRPRRAGVSSFGLGGTNAHLVLEEAPAAPAAAGEAREHHLLPLSARTPRALAAAAERLAAHLEARPELPLGDVAWTLQVGRAPFEHRRIAVARTAAEAAARLREGGPVSGGAAAAGAPTGGVRPAVAFLLPGQGAQHPGMARGLYRGEPAFRAGIDRCAEVARPRLNRDLRAVIDVEPGDPEAAAALADHAVAQAALFAVEHSLAELWRSWGVEPRALLGHSLGEWTAACLAGVFTLEDALAAVAERGRLMAASEAGAMLSVSLGEEDVAPLLGGGVVLAAANAPSASVVSGPEAAIAALEGELGARGVEHRRLRVSVAAHSPLMEPARRPLEVLVAGLRLAEPRIPFVSNVTGAWITAEEATDPAYWGRQLLSPVRFSRGLALLLGEAGRLLLEVGPGRSLAALASLHPEAPAAVTSLPHPKDATPAQAHLLGALGRLWTAGAAVDWQAHQEGRPRRRVSLPAYPFERRRFWVEADRPGEAGGAALPVPVATLPPPAAEEGEGAPAEAAGAGAGRPGYEEPQGEVERAVARIWEELLGVTPVGRSDDFYALGGHSLLATQVASRLRELFRIELSVEAMLEGPTVAKTARAVAAARGDGWAEGGGPELVAGEAIRPRDGDRTRASLSFSQERMWFLERLERTPGGGSSAYNLLFAVEMSGSPDLAALGAALGEVRRRHESLRTTFVEEGGQPVQVIGPPRGLPLPVVDLCRLPEPRRHHTARRLLRGEGRRPFDLERGPLVRARVVRLGPEEHLLTLAMHHIVSDGWSMGVVVREAAALYGAFTRREPSPLPPLPLQYPDYAAWQRRRLQGEVLDEHVAYWGERLTGLPAPLELATDRPRAARGGFELRAVHGELPAAVEAGVEGLARRSRATPFMVFLAAFAALLHRYTGETDLVVGAPIANRNRAEVEGLVGCFLNTLVLRARLDPGAGFAALVAEVRAAALGAYAHQDVPLEALLRAAGGDRRAGLGSLFRVMFLLQNVPRPRLEAAGLTLRELPGEEDLGAHVGTSLFDVTLTVDRAGEGLEAALTYDGGLFERATAARLVARYRRLLEAALADPERPLAALDLMGAGEREEVLAAGHGPAPVLPPVPFLDAFRARAAAAPEAEAAVALGAPVGGPGRLTYGELDRRSARLARRLAGLGVGVETRVGVAVERSPELLVALLGVLRAGGAYVPLDPAAPPERTAYVLEDAGARVVVASAGLAGLFEGSGREMVATGAGEEEGEAGAPDDAPQLPDAPAESAAYLIYTSGSTGRPKGVVVPHRSLDAFVAAAREVYGVTGEDRVLQFAALGFDTSVEEIFPALAAGATLVLRSEEMLRSPEAFLGACREAGVTLLDLPTAYFHELVADLGRAPAPPRVGPPLRLVILGGERVLPERLAAAAPMLDRSVRVLNTYGPTEATVVATRSEPLAEDPEGLAAGREVAIGRPLPGAAARVVDGRLEPAPAGVPGELVLGGPGVARGYLGRPGLTAERFVPDPFAEEAGARLYRTGDRARLRPSGALEFLGRLDHQVKVRGFRVELGEVEACLAACPGVREAAVLAREAAPGEVRLVAFLAVADAAPADGARATHPRAFAEERLPPYMVPAAFVELPELPHLPSGKVDRRALAALDEGPTPGRPARGARYRAPETPTEEAVARIFAQVLDLDPGAAPVGAGDDFFQLGGHSLLLPRVLHEVAAAFEVEVPLRALYEESTVAELALAIEELVIEELERLEPAS